jgi:hypothetical protein
MAILGIDPNVDVYRFGFTVGSIMFGLILFWLANRLLAGRGRSFTLEAKAVVLGAIMVFASRLLPWATVEYGRAHVKLYGDSFNTQSVILLALAIYSAAVLSEIWDAGILRVALLGVSLAAGAAAGLVAWQFLNASHDQSVAAFLDHGIPVFARELRVPLERAQAVAAALSARGSLEVSRQFGAYVLLAGGGLAIGGSLFNLAYGVARVFRQGRSTKTRFPTRPAPPSHGPLGRRGASMGTRSGLPGSSPSPRPRPIGPRPPAPSQVRAPAPAASSPSAAGIPSAPPMPVGSGGDVGRSEPSLDTRWAAGGDGRTERRRSGRRA